jgi:hypothetical protein
MTAKEIAVIYTCLNNVVKLERDINALVAEAVAAERVKAVEECEKAAAKQFGLVNTLAFSVCNAIRACATPQPPYPFGKNAKGKQCACWKKATGDIGMDWYRTNGREATVWLYFDANACEVCGAPRKEQR